MLDLITMTMAVGVQNELDTVRKESGAPATVFVEEQEESSSIVSAIESGVSAVESAVSTTFSAVIPSFEMFTPMEIEVGTAAPQKTA